jgi:hypothetical protein
MAYRKNPDTIAIAHSHIKLVLHQACASAAQHAHSHMQLPASCLMKLAM